MVDVVNGGSVDIAVADGEVGRGVTDAVVIFRDTAVEVVRIADARPGLAAVIGNGQVVLRGRELERLDNIAVVIKGNGLVTVNLYVLLAVRIVELRNIRSHRRTADMIAKRHSADHDRKCCAHR